MRLGLSSVRRGHRTRHDFPFRKQWRRALVQTYGREEGDRLLSAFSVRYAEVLAARPAFVADSPVLTKDFELVIAPLLAAHAVFVAEGAADPVSKVAEARAPIAAGRARSMQAMMRLLFTWPLFRWGVRKLMTLGMPPVGGWDWEWVEDSGKRLAFDVHGCFFQRVYAHYGVPELTRVSCDADDILFARLPRDIQFVREGTLGRGQPRCDFAFLRSGSGPIPLSVNRAP